jgi:ubiquitin-protein ligase E3 C
LEAVLDDLPHVLPFQDRVALLHNVILLDQGNREHTRAPWHRFEQQLHKIRRNFLVEDGFTAFADLDSEEEIRSIFKVEFIAPDGEPESGIDGGGLFKEFMIHICREVFDPKFGLFAVTDDQTLYPSPSAFRAHPNAAELYRFMGKVVGKAIYEMFLLEAQFSRVFLNRILGHTNEVDDVAALDKDLHKGMLRLKECPRVEDLALTFSISTAHLGHAEDVDLIPNGRNIPVTSANLTQYLHVVANFRTNLQLQRHTSAFMQGIQCCIPLSWLKMFDPYELNTLISGSSRGFDISDLYQHCVYGGGFNQRSQAIQWLWQLLQQMDSDDLGHFLMFTTSCSRPPLLGFKTLYPQFCIHMVPDATRLPTASTCANLLKLPNYGSFETLKLKVMQAIRAECGFDLS